MVVAVFRSRLEMPHCATACSEPNLCAGPSLVCSAINFDTMFTRASDIACSRRRIAGYVGRNVDTTRIRRRCLSVGHGQRELVEIACPLVEKEPARRCCPIHQRADVDEAGNNHAVGGRPGKQHADVSCCVIREIPFSEQTKSNTAGRLFSLCGTTPPLRARDILFDGAPRGLPQQP
jgi:hypothetical protein